MPRGEGNAITWNRPRRLGYGQKLAAGIRPSANELSTVRCSALIEVYGGYTLVEDLVQATAIVDPLEIATQELGKQAAETVDILFVHLNSFLNNLENLRSYLTVCYQFDSI